MDDRKFPEIELHQLLHGYQEGHTLISASVIVNPLLRRTIAVLTDMSGPSMQKGFEECITGFPLAEEGFYALSKTWYAPEMPRPGSVWTHTLLVSIADLPKIKDVSDLLVYFHRPEIDKKNYKDFFSKSIKCTINTDLDFITNSINDEITAKLLIQNLYYQPDKAIIVKSANSRRYESTILEIWMQQWPSLRRNFSFCTGAIYPRSINNRFFDLQACPEKFDRNYDIKPNQVVIDPNNQTVYEEASWVNIAVKDLSHPTKLRQYLTSYGADVGSSRVSFKKLLNFYVYLNELGSFITTSDIVNTLALQFSNPGEAERLKIDLLKNKVLDPYTWLPSIDESKLLVALSTIENYGAFNFQKLQFIERFEFLFDKLPIDGINLLNELLSKEINIWGEQLFISVAEKINETEFSNFFEILDKKLTFILISKNPRLLYSKRLWLIHKNDHSELFTLILRNKNIDSDIDWIRIISNVVETNTLAPFHLSHDESSRLVTQILDWSNSKNNATLNHSWINLIRSESEVVINWLLEHSSTMASNTTSLILSNLNPNSKYVTSTPTHVWYNLTLEFNGRGALDIQVSSFCLAVAFNKPDKHYLELVSKTFEKVYYALKKDDLPYEYWMPIQVHTKPLSWLNDWDKCKKLINALFENFSNLKWSKAQINLIFYTDEVRERAWSIYKKKYS